VPSLSNTDIAQANLMIFRTPDYMMSALQDTAKGQFANQTSVAQVTLRRNAVLFWSAPNSINEGVGVRPDYWSGNMVLPRVVQYRNVMALSWRLGRFTRMSHCFLERSRFDEIVFAGRWVFARVDDGYVAIFSENGFERDVPGRYQGRELVCAAPQNTWLVEAGRRADWHSFSAFRDAIQRAPLETRQGKLHYRSPSIGTFVVGWEGVPTVDGVAIQLRDYQSLEGAWGQSIHGSGMLRIRRGEESRDLFLY
jgi:hypothetical protein